jgi:hypothetical protein
MRRALSWWFDSRLKELLSLQQRFVIRFSTAPNQAAFCPLRFCRADDRPVCFDGCYTKKRKDPLVVLIRAEYKESAAHCS